MKRLIDTSLYFSFHLAVYNESDVQETISKINSHLPPGTVIVNDIRRVTKNFNCKNACDARTYKYLMPTYALSNVAQLPLPWHEDNLQEDVDVDDKDNSQERTKKVGT